MKSVVYLLLPILLFFVAPADDTATPCLMQKPRQSRTIARNNKDTLWTLQITQEGKVLNAKRPVFGFEVFVNNFMIAYLELAPSEINDVILNFRNTLTPSDKLKMILLNPTLDTFYVKKDNQFAFTDKEEIVFSFDPWMATHHHIELSEPDIQYADYYFFYVEKSGGISNLRHISDKLNEIAVEGKHFLVYYNAPDKAMVVQDASDITRLYNELFTAITQPPNPADELENVASVLKKFLPLQKEAFHLHLYFYLSEISHSYLQNQFLIPLLEERLPMWVTGQTHVHICTDFDVAVKNENYLYINILRTH